MISSQRSVSRPLLFALVLALASAVGAPEARAQDLLAADEAERHTDLARTLFTEGVALVAERRFEEAEAKFREALALHDAPSIRANLASALYEQGEYPEAYRLAAAIAADDTAPEASRESARVLEEQIRTAAGYVRVGGLEGDDAGEEVAIDAYVLPDRTAETPVSAGAHVATLTREGVERARRPFEITSGEHVTVTLDVEEAVHVDDIVATSPPPEPPLVEQWWFWTAIGGGVVLVAVAVGVGVALGSSNGGVESPIPGDFEPGVLRW